MGVVLLAGKTRVATATADVAARQKVVVPLTWTPPTAGAWELTAQVDPDQRQVEENRADNVVSLDLAVADAAQKNTAFSVSDLDLVTAGGRTVDPRASAQ